MKVKKYANRKLYFDGKYINLEDIISAIKQGEEVEVYRNDTGENCTEETLKEALKLVRVDNDKLLDLLQWGELCEK